MDVVHVSLPPGESLRDVEGIAYWSPDPASGRFTLTSSLGAADPLAAEREQGGEVTIEHDSTRERGGFPVRHLRYRVRRHDPSSIVRTESGHRHAGDEDQEHLSEVLLVSAGDRTVRAGYTVRTDADEDLKAALTTIFDRLRVGDER